MWTKLNFAELNKNHPVPSPRGFAFVFATLFFVFGVWKLEFYFLVAGALLLAIGLIKPTLLRGPNYLWHNLGLLIGWFSTPIVLTLMYSVAFVPMALVAKIFGHRAFKDKVGWVKKTKPCNFERIF